MFDSNAYFKEFKSFDETIPVSETKEEKSPSHEKKIDHAGEPVESNPEVVNSEVELAEMEKP